jgi:uncharacterized membrane protein/predicted DsbA family dithiol-disulfide isomerase
MITAVDIPAPVRVREAPPNSRLWWAMWGLIGIGVALTLVLVWQGNQLSSTDGGAATKRGLPGCGPGEPCNHVLRSQYATILGKSLTKWSLGYYVVVAAAMLAAIYAWQLSLSPPLSLMLPVVTLVGVVAGGWCLAVMIWKLQAMCYWCLSVHGVNLLLFISALAYATQAWRHRQFTRWEAGVPPLPSTPVAIHVIVALMIGTGQVMLMTLFHADARPTAEPIAIPEQKLGINPWSGGTPALAIGDSRAADKTAPIWTIKGPRDAPHRLVVFSCLTCPKCKELNAVLKEVLARHPDKLRVDVRFYPLWHGCNNRIPRGAMEAKHRDACALTRNALAVAMLKPEAFAEYVDWVYENQATMDDTLATNAAHLRVDKQQWNKTLDDPALWNRMREDLEWAQKLDIHSVPQIYLDKGQVYGGINADNLEALVAETFHLVPTGGKKPSGDAVWVADSLIVAHAQRGMAHAQLGRYQDAVRELEESLRLKGDWSEAAQHLAWILATCPDDSIRDGQRALKYARLAQQTSKEPTPLLLDVLAAALAEAGEFQEAADTARKAVELYTKAGSEKLANEVRDRMDMYIGGRAYRTGR